MWSGRNHRRPLSSRVCCGSALVVRSRLRQAEDGTNPRDTYAQLQDTILHGSSTSCSEVSSTWASRSGRRRNSAVCWSPTSSSLASSRIWAHGRKFDRSVGSLPSMRHRYWAIVAIIVESGAIYSSALIIEIALCSSLPHCGFLATPHTSLAYFHL